MEICERQSCFYSFYTNDYDVCVAEDKVECDDVSYLYVCGVWYSDTPDIFTAYISDEKLFYYCILKNDRESVEALLEHSDFVNDYSDKLSLRNRVKVLDDVRFQICGFLQEKDKYCLYYDYFSFKELYGLDLL